LLSSYIKAVHFNRLSNHHLQQLLRMICWADLEKPISLASLWCCTNSWREASLLGGAGGIWGRMVEAIMLLMKEEEEPWEELTRLSTGSGRVGSLATWNTLCVTLTAGWKGVI